MLVLWVATRRTLVGRHPDLNMEAVCSSETLVSTYQSTRRHNQKEQHGHLHRRENIKSHY
jgi:hypothetical protein